MNFQQIQIHAGLPKAGSSSIQQALHQHRDLLAIHDIHYAQPEGTQSSKNHNQLFLNFAKTGILFPSIFSPKSGRLIFSSEAISTQFGHYELKALVNHLQTELPHEELQFILYVRHPLELLRSTFQHYLKWGEIKIQELAEAPPIPKIRKLITKFQRLSKGSRLTVRQLELPVTETKSHEKDFLALAGLPEKVLASLKTESVRNSLSHESTLALELVKMYDYQKRIDRAMLIPKLNSSGAKFYLPEAFLKRYSNVLLQDASWLAQEYKIHYDLSGPFSISNPTKLTQEDITDQVVDILNEYYPQQNITRSQIQSDFRKIDKWLATLC